MQKRYWQDLTNALIAAWVIASPWVLISGARVFQAGDRLPAWELMISGALLGANALSAWSRAAARKEWINAAFGALICLFPLLWTGQQSSALAWSTVISGLLVLALAGSAAADAHNLLPGRRLSKKDLRSGLPELALPDESEHMAGGWLPPEQGPDIVAPGTHVQAAGDTVKG